MKTKCIYCDFDNHDHVGADFITGKPTNLDDAIVHKYHGYPLEPEYQFLKVNDDPDEPGYYGLISLFDYHEADFGDWDCDEINYIEYCPKCGRYLGNFDIKSTYGNNKVLYESDRTRRQIKLY